MNHIPSEEFQTATNIDGRESAGQKFIVSIDALNEVSEMVGPDDTELLAELIDEYLADSDEIVEQMQAQLEKDDRIALQRAAHSLKSTSATFGVLPLAEFCKQLEDALRDDLPNVDYGMLLGEISVLHQRSRAELEREKAQRLA